MSGKTLKETFDMANIDPYPNFGALEFLEQHITTILTFYDPIVFSEKGGFHGCFFDNGESFSPESRQLVGSARYVFNYATTYRLYSDPKHLEWATHGLEFLTTRHRQNSGGYAWLIEDGVVVDNRVMAYGHAFVLLAAASCVQAGITAASDVLSDVYTFMETYFWDEAGRAYADERDASLETLSPYRGQNANMHMCEALLAAWQATSDERYLNRAEILADRFAIELAAQSGGQVWEHYDLNWTVDMGYNIDTPNDRYRPWGFQVGHQTEWTKLLLILDAERPDPKWLPRAKALYDAALSAGWDETHGGLVYGLAPDGSICSDQKHFWVQAETFAAAWRLYKRTQDETYLEDYWRIWQWSWDNMIDHEYGAWFRVKARDGTAIDNKKSPLGKTDYHTMGACWDVLSTF